MRRRSLLLLLLCCLLPAWPLPAQGNLLQNPGMQGDYATLRVLDDKPIKLPPGWSYWLHPPDGEYTNRQEKVDMQPHPGPGPNPQEGNRALAIDCGYVTCTVAVFQQVSVPQGHNLSASAWSHVRACNNIPCQSAIESGSQTRIGIDPNGGNNPNDADIVWSNWSQPHDQWQQVSVNATSTGPAATLFLYSTQGSVAHLNKTYWDNVSLVDGGPGDAAAPAQPAAPAQVPFVAAQQAADDGSLVHVVRAGNTIDSIAVAYDLTRDQLLALNPDITNPRIISIGQEIVVRRSGGVTAPAERVEEEAPREDAAPAEAAEPEPETRVSDVARGSRRAVTSEAGANLAPAPVSVAALPAMDPLAMRASVCVTLFEDVNRNRLREPGEAALANGMLLLTGAEGEARMATGEEAGCFEELAAGAWTLQVDAPEGYGLTAPDQLQISLPAGARLDVAVGAAAGLQPVLPPPPDESPVFRDDVVPDATAGPLDLLLANLGYVAFGLAGLVLLAGGALTLALRRR